MKFVLAGLVATALANEGHHPKSILKGAGGRRGASQRHLYFDQQVLDEDDSPRTFTPQIHKEFQVRFKQGLAGIKPMYPCFRIQREQYPGCLWAYCYENGRGDSDVGKRFQTSLMKKVWRNSEKFNTYRTTLTEEGYKCVLEYRKGRDCITPPDDYEYSGCR